MSGTVLSLVLSGSVALLAGGGAYAVTRSHYQRKLQDLEGKLRVSRDKLREAETELSAKREEVERLREILALRERRMEELAASIAALRDVTVDLDRRLRAHDSPMRSLLATLALRGGHHRREGELLRKRQVRTQRSLDGFNREETGLQAELIEVKAVLTQHVQALECAEEEVRTHLAAEQAAEEEIAHAVHA